MFAVVVNSVLRFLLLLALTVRPMGEQVESCDAGDAACSISDVPGRSLGREPSLLQKAKVDLGKMSVLDEVLTEIKELGGKIERQSEEINEVKREVKQVPLQPSFTHALASDSTSQILNNAADQNQLFEACQAKAEPVKQTQMLIIAKNATKPETEAVKPSMLEDQSGCSAHPIAACASGELSFTKYGLGMSSQKCCAQDSVGCAGCDVEAGGGCSTCSAGYRLMPDGSCATCVDSAGWLNELGRSCYQLSSSSCSDELVHGITSNQACCQCGGGTTTGTAFTYEIGRFAVGQDISMAPKPRTALFYSVDQGCALGDYNLTFDPKTGIVAMADGKDKPTEPFAVSCQVTAIQSDTVYHTTSLALSTSYISYEPAVVLTATGSLPSVSSQPDVWSTYAIDYCMPTIDFVSIDSATGKLTLKANATDAVGAVSSGEEEAATPQPSAFCTISATRTPGTGNATTEVAKVLVCKPTYVSTISYSPAQVFLAVGENAPALKFTEDTDPDPTKMKVRPSKFHVECSSHLGYYFDESISTGFLQGHRILEVGPDGEIDISAPEGLVSVFDDLGMQADSSTPLYSWIDSGDCESKGLDFIDSFQECKTAATSLSFSTTGACFDEAKCQANAPRNCGQLGGKLTFNGEESGTCGSGSIASVASSSAKMLCRSRTKKLMANNAALDMGIQKALSLKCTVWAGFPNDVFPAVTTSLEVSFLDKMCWVQQKNQPVRRSAVEVHERECMSAWMQNHDQLCFVVFYQQCVQLPSSTSIWGGCYSVCQVDVLRFNGYMHEH